MQFIARQLIETGKLMNASLATQRSLAVSAGTLILGVAATGPAMGWCRAGRCR